MKNQTDKKILVVDDDESIRILLDRVIGTINRASAVLASNVNEGIAFFSKNKIDLIITDLNMPSETGLILLSKVKEKNPNIPVIIFSGSLNEEERSKANEMEADMILAKPCEVSTLKQIISDLLFPKPR